MNLLHCVLYLAFLGIACFPFGRLLARCPLNAEKFPFAAFRFEKDGKIYEKLKIRKWQHRVPDVSRLAGCIVPKKELSGTLNARKLSQMVKETCVAELTHFVLCLCGLYIPAIVPGVWGGVLCAIYIVLGNLSFMVIQRYNRPRLKRLLASAKKKESGRNNEGSDPQLQ